VFPGTLPEDVSGGTAGFEIVLLVENGAQLADFEGFGGDSDHRRVSRCRRRTG